MTDSVSLSLLKTRAYHQMYNDFTKALADYNEYSKDAQFYEFTGRIEAVASLLKMNLTLSDVPYIDRYVDGLEKTYKLYTQKNSEITIEQAYRAIAERAWHDDRIELDPDEAARRNGLDLI